MADADPFVGWVRGSLELALLAALAGGEGHGYALAQHLADQGLGQIRGGALYPVLGKLEAAGSVQATWLPGEGGPGRKVYAITPAGQERLAAERVRWREFAGAFDRMLTATERASTRLTRTESAESELSDAERAGTEFAETGRDQQ